MRVIRAILPPLLATGIVFAVMVALRGQREHSLGKLPVVYYQRAADAGPGPFTAASEVRGTQRVALLPLVRSVSGRSSNRVCDRELLIRLLVDRPQAQRRWGQVLDVPPDTKSITRFIRRLRPATLVNDVRVTDHSLRKGQALAFQAVLEAGSATLVDDKGRILVRCRGGNPLRPYVNAFPARCNGCPIRTPSPDASVPDRPRRAVERRSRAGVRYLLYPEPPPLRKPADQG